MGSSSGGNTYEMPAIDYCWDDNLGRHGKAPSFPVKDVNKIPALVHGPLNTDRNDVSFDRYRCWDARLRGRQTAKFATRPRDLREVRKGDTIDRDGYSWKMGQTFEL